ncbi:MAG: phosphoribosylaminoimidazolesuccinocarboxamide synthase [bacterium]|nr:phosphoribosylaminoimidazolesuccinocarboxamide synthase [bacterium]
MTDSFTKGEMLYEGKAKRLYATTNPGELIMEFKDDLTAFDAVKKGQEAGKGAVNNRISALLMGALAESGIESTFIKVLDANHSLVRSVQIVPLEVIVRYEAHGSLCRRYGIEAGKVIDPPLVEIGYKNDELHDPFLSDEIAVLMGLASFEEIARIRYMALVTGEKLREIYGAHGIKLLDFKLEFGRWQSPQGERIILADEVTPDTCRLVDAKTGEKLDKDLFRFDLGDVGEGYRKLLAKMEAV